MVIWLNGSFGVGKTVTAGQLNHKIKNSHIYDPEQIGYFLWNVFPPDLKRKGDFQDLEMWRKFNYELIKYVCQNFNGHLIVPMTLVNPDYWNEIVGALQKQGILVYHFVLTAPKETIIQRLLCRGEEKNSWAEQQIDRCLQAFDQDIPGEQIDTTFLTIDQVANSILEKCNFPIEKEKCYGAESCLKT